MKLSIISTIGLLALGLAAGCSKSNPGKPTPQSQYTDAQIVEEFGWFMGSQTGVADLGLNKAELDLMLKGLRAAAEGKPSPYDLATIGPKMDVVMGKKQSAHQAAVKDKNTSDGVAFFAKLAKEKKAVELPSGLFYEVLKQGDGPAPKPTDTVKVHYVGKFVDGTVFEDSREAGQPAEFPLNRVIAGWTEGLQKVGKGGKLKLYIPAKLAYGDEGRPGMPPAASLVFELELIDINPTPAPVLPGAKE